MVLAVGFWWAAASAEGRERLPGDGHYRWLVQQSGACSYCEPMWRPGTRREEAVFVSALLEVDGLADREGAWGYTVPRCERWSKRRWQCQAAGYFEATDERHGFEGIARCPLPVTLRIGRGGWISAEAWWADDCSRYRPKLARVRKG